jgi:hypothetical protein
MDEQHIGTVGWFVWGYWSNRFWRWNGLTMNLTNQRVIVRFLGLLNSWEIPIKSIKKVCLVGFKLGLLAPAIRIYFEDSGKIENFTFSVLRSHNAVLELFRKAHVLTSETDDGA